MMGKIVILLMLASSLLFSSVGNIEGNKILTDTDIASLERGILKAAIKNRDVSTVSHVALSYFVTSESPLYKGDRKALHKRAIDLLSFCVKNGDISGALFITTKYLKANPAYSREIAKYVIEEAKNSDVLRSNPEYQSVVMLYASSVLDNQYKDKKEINEAIEAIMGLPVPSAQSSFFLAFLFKALGSYSLADTYLNEACHQSKPGSRIYNYCLSGSDVEKIDSIESRVVKPDCKADIGERCK
jgi:hypothetical protein